MTREYTLQFGRSLHLAGVVHEPTGSWAEVPAFLIIGEEAPVPAGPARVLVGWARAAAARGVPSLRFGVGSAAAATSPFQDGSALDVLDALDETVHRGWGGGSVILCLDTGVDLARRAAILDPRILGIVVMGAVPSRAIAGLAATGASTLMLESQVHPASLKCDSVGQQVDQCINWMRARVFSAAQASPHSHE